MAASSGQESAAEESDVASTASEAPPDWNSDDEPPEDHEGDEHACSRDGGVKRVIRRVGRGLEKPGQYDFVRMRFRVLQNDDAPEVADCSESHECEVQMGEDKLPLAVEFALKSMRIGEIAEVRAPAAYAVKASPLCGRRLRTKPGVLPKQEVKLPRRLRFLPAAPRSVAEEAKAALVKFKKAEKAAAAAGEGASDSKPPMYRAEVELLGLDCVHMLTEDRTVAKRLVSAGRSRRQPRSGDEVTFSVVVIGSDGSARSAPQCHTLTLGEAKMPYQGLGRVLLSMKEGERCLALLNSHAAADEAGVVPEGELQLEVTLHRWRRHDVLPVEPFQDNEAKVEGRTGAASSSSSFLRKTELRPGSERRTHDIEAGSIVLAGLARGTGSEKPVLLSWRIGQGAVPGYIETAVASMRLTEGAAFEATAEAQSCRPKGPAFEGQTPLRKYDLGSLCSGHLGPLLEELLEARDEALTKSTADTGAVQEGEAELAQSYQLPPDWPALGQAITWEEVALVQDGRFRLVLLEATEAIDVCLLDDDEQMRYLDIERAHGNALARTGRFQEASVAYSRALDAVRRTPLYKALFPGERGHIKGAYSRDAGEVEKPPLEQFSESEVSSRRSALVALHMNLSLCAGKAGKHAVARRHADTALSAEPGNAKALFRRGQAAAGMGDLEDAISDLQKALELLPQDRGIRVELQAAQRSLREHREAQKNMFQNVFQPAARTSSRADGESQQ